MELLGKHAPHLLPSFNLIPLAPLELALQVLLMELLGNEMLDYEGRVEGEELQSVADIGLCIGRDLAFIGPICQEDRRWLLACDSGQGFRSWLFDYSFFLRHGF